MPYKTIQIENLNSAEQTTVQNSQFYKGFSSVDPQILNTKVYDFELVKQDIINHFNTKKGERLMNPSFGSAIWDILMEPLTEQTRNILLDDIKYVCEFDSRVNVEEINVVEYETGFLIEITLILKTTNQLETLKLKFDQAIGLTVL